MVVIKQTVDTKGYSSIHPSKEVGSLLVNGNPSNPLISSRLPNKEGIMVASPVLVINSNLTGTMPGCITYNKSKSPLGLRSTFQLIGDNPADSVDVLLTPYMWGKSVSGNNGFTGLNAPFNREVRSKFNFSYPDQGAGALNLSPNSYPVGVRTTALGISYAIIRGVSNTTVVGQTPFGFNANESTLVCPDRDGRCISGTLTLLGAGTLGKFGDNDFSGPINDYAQITGAGYRSSACALSTYHIDTTQLNDGYQGIMTVLGAYAGDGAACAYDSRKDSLGKYPPKPSNNNTIIASGLKRPDPKGNTSLQDLTAVNCDSIARFSFSSGVSNTIGIGWNASILHRDSITITSNPGGAEQFGGIWLLAPNANNVQSDDTRDATQIGTAYLRIDQPTEIATANFTLGTGPKMLWASLYGGGWSFKNTYNAYPAKSTVNTGQDGDILVSNGSGASPDWKKVASFSFTSQDGKKVTVTNGLITGIQ